MSCKCEALTFTKPKKSHYTKPKKELVLYKTKEFIRGRKSENIISKIPLLTFWSRNVRPKEYQWSGSPKALGTLNTSAKDLGFMS